MTPWWEYVARHMAARDWRAADLAQVSGLDPSVIGRWRDRGTRPTPENVRKTATGLGRPIREAIIAAGHYTAEEIDGAPLGTRVDLGEISHETLAREVLARMRAGTARRRRPAQVPPVEVPAQRGHDA